MPNFVDRIKHAFNLFNVNTEKRLSLGVSSAAKPDRPRLHRGGEKSLINAVYNRMAIDCASIGIVHARLDDNDRFTSEVKSGLNNCLTLEANADQTYRSFLHDVYLSMFDEGYIAIVPTHTTDFSPLNSTTYNIAELRTAQILEWYPKDIKVRVYNEDKGEKVDVIVPKKMAAIVENPFYAVMNEANSTVQRIIRKLAILDMVDEQYGAGKLDLIISLPYAVKTPAKKQMAEDRKKELEKQLSESKYGIAYTDGTEKITQLNRSLENNLMTECNQLLELFYSQLGLTANILNGTASDAEMLNYNNRTIEPCVSALVDELNRKFLTKTARTQGQSIMFFRDPFRLVPVNQIAEIADKFTRNEIMSPNEIRQVVGLKPVNDAHADELRNRNINASDGQTFANSNGMAADTGGANADALRAQEINMQNQNGGQSQAPQISDEELDNIIENMVNEGKSDDEILQAIEQLSQS